MSYQVKRSGTIAWNRPAINSGFQTVGISATVFSLLLNEGIDFFPNPGTGFADSALVLRQLTLPSRTQARNILVVTVSAQPASGSLVFTMLYNEGTETGIVLTISAGSGSGTYVNNVDVDNRIAGDRMIMRIVNNSAVAGSARIAYTGIGLY